MNESVADTDEALSKENNSVDGYHDYQFKKRFFVWSKMIAYFFFMSTVMTRLVNYYGSINPAIGNNTLPDLIGKPSNTSGKFWRAATFKTSVIFLDVMFYFFSMVSLLIFILFTRCRRFYTRMERAGYGARFRYQTDFLEFVQDDVHYI